MPRQPIENNDEKLKELESRILELENFSKKLIEALAAAEKTSKNYYLPEGKYFGITIE